MCLHAHRKTLPFSICLVHEDVECIQQLDYEHVPFRCRKCHKNGNLYRACPLNGPLAIVLKEETDKDGFKKSPTRKC